MTPDAVAASHPPAVRARVEALLAQRGDGARPFDLAAAARDVVLIGSSSRGGSSIFAEILRQSPSLLHLRAEMNPWLRLAGLEGEDSDAIPADTPVPAGLGRLLAADCGNPTRHLHGEAQEWAFAVDITVRLTLQWPREVFDVGAVHAATEAVLHELRAEGWPPGRFVDAQEFHARLLARLRQRWPTIHPGAYDLDRRLVERWCPEPLPPYCPPPHRDALVEEPPFVLVTPWRPATEEDVARRPIVLKTPSNAYRLDWLRRVFPAADVRVLHLVRNAAASINGLYDGWRYPGFHSHLCDALAIAGYTGEVPGGDRWWKFDRPPGWQAYTHAPLEVVCGFLWRSAHAAILADHGSRHLLRFEDMLGDPGPQAAAIASLGHWLGVDLAADLAHVLADARSLPLVMATEPPRRRRWFARVGVIGPVVADPEIEAVMGALGYPPEPEAWG